MYKGFDALPEEHFYDLKHDIAHEGDQWGWLIVNGILSLFAFGFIELNESLPSYFMTTFIVIMIIQGAYILPCIILSPKRVFGRFRQAVTFLYIVGMVNLRSSGCGSSQWQRRPTPALVSAATMSTHRLR